jgi:anaerobic magnesium-protoporphyrin IX monomethyl ester cyclase
VRVCLIVPNNHYRGVLWSVLPSRGLLSIAAVLSQGGNQVQYIDADIDDLTDEQVLNEIVSFGTDLVGITVNMFQADAAHRLARFIRAALPKMTIVAGGPHPSALGRDFLWRYGAFDVAVVGEGESIALRLRPGMTGTIGPDPLIKGLDSIPFPAYDLAEPLARYPGEAPVRWPPSMHVLASRGCSYQCTFCSKPVFGDVMRWRDPVKVVDEVEYLHGSFEIQEINFHDDTMNARKPWFLAVCREIIRRRLHKVVTFRTSFRVNLVDDEILEAARAANFWLIFYGVESGNQAVLDEIKKGITVGQVERAFAMTHHHGLKALAAFMVGNAGETRETVQDSIDLAKRIDPDYLGVSTATPIPGTPFYKRAKALNWIESDDLSRYSEFDSVMHNDSLTSREIRQLRIGADWQIRKYLFVDRNPRRFMARLAVLADRFHIPNELQRRAYVSTRGRGMMQ